MKTPMRSFFLGFLAMPFLAVGLFGADAALRGVVTDTSGKPVRGAIVKATLGPKASAASRRRTAGTKFQSQRAAIRCRWMHTDTA